MTKTKAPVPPPPPRTKGTRKVGYAQALPKRDETQNLQKTDDKLTDLNFKVSADFHRAFKVAATERGMKMKDLLEASFKEYLRHYPAQKPSDIFKG